MNDALHKLGHLKMGLIGGITSADFDSQVMESSGVKVLSGGQSHELAHLVEGFKRGFEKGKTGGAVIGAITGPDEG